MSERSPRLRFAPSPTGPLHIGGARTALYNWVAARALGGSFLLRIEDTDRARSSERWLESILEGLGWLGIDWDEGPGKDGGCGPYFQTQRLDLYRSAAERLLASGHAYRCYATPEEVEEGRRALAAQGKRPMYDRRHRDLGDEQRAAFEAEGRQASIRFRIPLGGILVMDDLCKGRVEIESDILDDWVMVRPDGMPTYNLACSVDDDAMAITHVVRGDEHAMNGFKQILVHEALGAEAPRFAHIPLILGKDGKKLSKRDVSTNLLDYRDHGYPPEAVFNYIALLGWSWSGDRETFTAGELIEVFRIEDIGRGGARFDDEKLRSMCGKYIRETPRDELVARTRPFLESAGAVPAAAFRTHPALIAGIVGCFQERIELYGELPEKVAPFFADTVEPDEPATKKLLADAAAADWLDDYAARLEAGPLAPSYPDDRGDVDRRVALPTKPQEHGTDPDGVFGPRALEADARAFAAALDVKFGRFVHPVRAALTGTTRGPGLFDVVFLLGRTTAAARLRAGAERIRAAGG